MRVARLTQKVTISAAGRDAAVPTLPRCLLSSPMIRKPLRMKNIQTPTLPDFSVLTRSDPGKGIAGSFLRTETEKLQSPGSQLSRFFSRQAAAGKFRKKEERNLGPVDLVHQPKPVL